jgi:hypothetical protein
MAWHEKLRRSENMAAFGAVDISTRSPVDVRREAVVACETKLAAARKQRDVVLIDKRVAEARVDKGDQLARREVASLGKQDVELGRLVLSVERQLREAKKWLVMAETQAATAAAKRAELDDAALVRDKVFAIKCPDGRVVRHRGASQEDVRRRLQPGYIMVGQVHGADADGNGGIIPRPGFLTAMLEAYEGELIEWLEARGIVGSDKTVVVLPNNNRESMQ